MKLAIENYEQIGPDRYSCVPVPGFEKDPAVTKAIREFDPGLIPIWRIQVWRYPNSRLETKVVHHGIARFYPIPRYLRRRFHVEMPAVQTHPAPNFLDAILEDDSTLDFKRGGPGGYVAWDWRLYSWCRAQYLRLTVKNWLAAVERRIERTKREHAALMDDIEGKKAEIEPWILRKLETIGDPAWRQYMEVMWGKNRGKVRLRPDPKGFMHLSDPKMFATVPRPPRADKTYGRVAPAQDPGVSNGNP